MLKQKTIKNNMSLNLTNCTQFILNGTAYVPVISGYTDTYTDNTQYATGSTIQIEILNQVEVVITNQCHYVAVNSSGTTSNLISVGELGLVTIDTLDLEDGYAEVIVTIDGNTATYIFDNLLS